MSNSLAPDRKIKTPWMGISYTAYSTALGCTKAAFSESSNLSEIVAGKGFKRKASGLRVIDGVVFLNPILRP
jgi:hypothetical protein